MVGLALDLRFQRPMEAFQQVIGGGMVGRCSLASYATQSGEGVKELRLELLSCSEELTVFGIQTVYFNGAVPL